jgi:hypothetical protein
VNVIRNVWPIWGGTVVIEVRTDQPLPPEHWKAVGEAIASIDVLAATMNTPTTERQTT